LGEVNIKPKPTIGLPRGLIHFKFSTLWITFFEELGLNVVVSPLTNKEIRDYAVRKAPEEDCFSTKLYIGHVFSIAEKVDYLFIPRFGSKHETNVGCPKFVGLAEVLTSMYPELPPIIMPYYSKAKAGHTIWRLIKIGFSIGFRFTKNPFKITRAIRKAFKAYKDHLQELIITEEELHQWENSELVLNDKPKLAYKEKPLKIALVGHSYVINDPSASINIRKRLQNLGVDVITSEQMPRELIEQQMETLDFNMYFDFEREILGTIMHFLESKTVDGIIHMMIFSCGPDSIAGEMAMRFAKRTKGVQMLQLVLDELTGEAGFTTRIEAFVDMLRRRKKKDAIYIPTLRVT
jgi:predicted nucleotide-binding protein (sugar kinase/HSP70/actin superfamily)